MHPILKNITIKNLIKHNEVYILVESKSGNIVDQYVHNLCIVKSDAELFDAVSTDLETFLSLEFTCLKFLGVQRLSEDCHQITVRVSSKKTGFESLYNWYVHRVPSCSERNFELNRMY